MTDHTNTRRTFIRRFFCSFAAFSGAAFVLSRCKPKGNAAVSVSSCDDYSHVSEEELKKRKELGYVEESPVEDRECRNCNLWLPPEGENPCGGCALFEGPVYDEAYCTYWAPQE